MTSEQSAENRRLVEELLGWKVEDSKLGYRFRSPTNWTGYMAGMTFTTWDTCGLLLEAMAKRGARPMLWPTDDGGWMCVVQEPHGTCQEPTGPLAIRAAALAVCEESKCKPR